MPEEIVCARMGEETGHTWRRKLQFVYRVWFLQRFDCYLYLLALLAGEKKAKAWNFLPPKSSKQSPFTEVKKGNVLF